MGIATAQLVGNLTSDPKPNASGTLCNLRVAVNDRRKVGDEWQDVANYFDVIAFGGQAENCVKYLSKGRQVAVSGRLQWREWTDKEGNSRQSVEIVANEVQFIGPREEAKPEAEGDRESETGGW